jgi:hypothetical protein
VKTSGGTNSGYNREAHLRFSIASLPAGTVSSVKLRVFGRLNTTGQNNIPVALHAVSNTTWGETAIKWSNRPAAGTRLGQMTLPNTTARWFELDVTSYVNAQRAAGRTAVSFVLKGVTGSGPVPTFTSRSGGANAPQLVLVTQPAARPEPIVPFARGVFASAHPLGLGVDDRDLETARPNLLS